MKIKIFETQFAQTTKAYDSIKSEWNQLVKSQNDVNTLFESLFENNKILTIVDDNKGVWFKGKDIGSVLRYGNTMDAIITHVEEIDKIVIF